MIARNLKPGMKIGIWTVVNVFEVCGVVEMVSEYVGSDLEGAPVSMKTAERSPDPWNTLIMVELERGIPDLASYRTWYRADEDVEVMR